MTPEHIMRAGRRPLIIEVHAVGAQHPPTSGAASANAGLPKTATTSANENATPPRLATTDHIRTAIRTAHDDYLAYTVANGQTTVLGALSSNGWDSNIWARVQLIAQGNVLQVQVTRADTGQYLNENGDWQSPARRGG